MADPLYGLVAGHHGAEQDDEHHDHPGQVLHPPVAEREAPADAQTGEREGDPQRYGGSRISEVVDGIRQQGHTARQQHHDDLQEGCRREHHEGPLDSPDAMLGGGYGGVYGPVGMAVTSVFMMLVPVLFAGPVRYGRDSTIEPGLFTRVRRRGVLGSSALSCYLKFALISASAQAL